MLDVKVLDNKLGRIFRSAAAIFIGMLGLGFPALAQAGPSLVTVFPLGGQRGQTLEVGVRGTGLTGAYAVWLGAGTRLDNRLPSAQANVKPARTLPVSRHTSSRLQTTLVQQCGC
jgi:hypothetical protein